MKRRNELYVEKLPGESIRAYFERYRSKTGDSPTRETFIRGYKPFHAEYEGRNWAEHHRILASQVGMDNYTWYGHHFFFSNEDDVLIFKLCCMD